MSKYLRKMKLKKMRKIIINDRIFNYYEDTLIALGLNKKYIVKHNYFFFGDKELEDQDIINGKFIEIENTFTNFFDNIIDKYNTETLVFELGSLYTKLQKIYLDNDELLIQNNKMDNIADISYASRTADLMRRKLKNLIEIVILKDNKKMDFGLKNSNYKKFVLLLYYHSLYIFYRVRSNFSKEYENGITEFMIRPKDSNCITTYIKDNIEKNDNKVHYNYNPKIDFKIDKDFNEAFLTNKGILFSDYIDLMNELIKLLDTKSVYNAKLNIKKFDDYIKKAFPNINIENFNTNCILRKNSFEHDENNLYKNTCKHRIDTTPIIALDNDNYIINKGFLWYSKNFWNNVQLLGLKPYIDKEKDRILESAEKIVKKISSNFEEDIIKILQKIYSDIVVFHGKKSKDIFKNKKVDENEWDIIAIDHKKKYIFDVEAKYITTSMTESTLSNDLKKIIGNQQDSYKNKFEKRLKIEEENLKEFLTFCEADETYKIVHVMVVSKIVNLDIVSNNREFIIINYSDLEEYIKENIK